MERGIRRTYTWFYLPDDVFFEPVLKAYEGPDKFFLHNVNAANLAIGCKPVRSRCAYHLCSSSRYGASTRRNGGARRSRTDDILLAKQALYQLSYGPIKGTSRVSRRRCHGPAQRLVGPGRLELPTLRLSGVRSNHLSYGPSAVRQPRQHPGSRSRHHRHEPQWPKVVMTNGWKEKRRRRRPAFVAIHDQGRFRYAEPQ